MCQCNGRARFGNHRGTDGLYRDGPGGWTDWVDVQGEIRCHVDEFEGVDPLYGVPKICECEEARTGPSRSPVAGPDSETTLPETTSILAETQSPSTSNMQPTERTKNHFHNGIACRIASFSTKAKITVMLF